MDAPAADFDELHRRRCPTVSRARPARRRPATSAMRRRSRSVCPTAAPTAFLPDADAIRIEPGDDHVVVELDLDAWRDRREITTAAGLFYGGRVRFVRGTKTKLGRWGRARAPLRAADLRPGARRRGLPARPRSRRPTPSCARSPTRASCS
jgi:hypothetical protein